MSLVRPFINVPIILKDRSFGGRFVASGEIIIISETLLSLALQLNVIHPSPVITG